MSDETNQNLEADAGPSGTAASSAGKNVKGGLHKSSKAVLEARSLIVASLAMVISFGSLAYTRYEDLQKDREKDRIASARAFVVGYHAGCSGLLTSWWRQDVTELDDATVNRIKAQVDNETALAQDAANALEVTPNVSSLIQLVDPLADDHSLNELFDPMSDDISLVAGPTAQAYFEAGFWLSASRAYTLMEHSVLFMNKPGIQNPGKIFKVNGFQSIAAMANSKLQLTRTGVQVDPSFGTFDEMNNHFDAAYKSVIKSLSH